MDKRDLIQNFPELFFEGAAYDFALPQPWVDDVYRLTKIYPSAHFVWYYPPRGDAGHIWGKPFPLDDEGKDILAKYEAAIKNAM